MQLEVGKTYQDGHGFKWTILARTPRRSFVGVQEFKAVAHSQEHSAVFSPDGATVVASGWCQLKEIPDKIYKVTWQSSLGERSMLLDSLERAQRFMHSKSTYSPRLRTYQEVSTDG